MKAIIARVENNPLYNCLVSNIGFQRSYSMTSLILIFFSFAGLGWVWEVAIHIVEDGQFVNRGVMTGPWLPIYGVGTLLILMILKRWQERPLKLFVSIVLFCGAMEYITGFALEYLFGHTWWDYSNMIFQIHGRVCLSGLLIFGVGGLFIVYLVAPLLDQKLQKISERTRKILCVFLLLLFAVDMVYSYFNPNVGPGITWKF